MTLMNKILSGVVVLLILGVGLVISQSKPQAQGAGGQNSRAEITQPQTPGENGSKEALTQVKSPDSTPAAGDEGLEILAEGEPGQKDITTGFSSLSIRGKEGQVLILKGDRPGPEFVAFDRAVFPPEFQPMLKKQQGSFLLRTRQYTLVVKEDKYRGKLQYKIVRFK